MTPDDDPVYGSSEEMLAALKESRRYMLLAAINNLQEVTPQRMMIAGLEVLHAAIADLDVWEKGMAEVIERDTALSAGELPLH
jgi:hypothetical protein